MFFYLFIARANNALRAQDQKYYVGNLIRAFSISDSDYFGGLYREHLHQSMQAIAFSKCFKPIDPRLIRERTVILPQKDIYKGKELFFKKN